jgi:tryptophan synthase alpha chain
MEYPLTRLDQKILSLKKTSKKAMVAYLVAGDPDLESTLELMHGFVNAGVDILEIGVPFTDPIAEGPIIQAAHDRALKNDTSLNKIFELVEEFRKKKY